MRGILKGIKHLPSWRSDWLALNNPYKRKLQDYRNTDVQIGNISAKYASPDQNSLVKLVIDTYENAGSMHLHTNTQLVLWSVGGKNFACTVQQNQNFAKRSDARLTTSVYQGHTHTPKEETAVPLTAGSDRTAQEKNKLFITFAKAGFIQAAPHALTALKLHFSYI